jgi:serine/threonine protein phosphatase 1
MCIDTWPYSEGWLTCLEMNSGQLWQANQQGETRTGNINKFLVSFDELATLYRVKRTI